jgi:hypothetical protein
MATGDRIQVETHSQGEIFPQRVSFKSIVGQDSPPTRIRLLEDRYARNSQVWVAAEEDTKHVPNFSLVPVCSSEKTDARWDGGDLVGVGFDSDTRLVGNGKKVVYDLACQFSTSTPDHVPSFECMEKRQHTSNL